MPFYEDLENIVSNASAQIMSNQNICKLLYYYPKNTDLRYDPYAQPDIEKPNELLLKHIFPIPKTPDAQTNQICFIDVTVSGGEKYRNGNTGFRRILLHFDIVCHLDAWFIKGGFRPIRIMSEIDKMFNNQQGLNVVNLPQPLPFYAKDYSNKFYGYQLTYELLVNSNIPCGVEFTNGT